MGIEYRLFLLWASCIGLARGYKMTQSASLELPLEYTMLQVTSSGFRSVNHGSYLTVISSITCAHHLIISLSASGLLRIFAFASSIQRHHLDSPITTNNTQQRGFRLDEPNNTSTSSTHNRQEEPLYMSKRGYIRMQGLSLSQT
jgi:hypothetical protein